ncbi:MAG: PIG-L family deacetylase [Anaerolineaceae bacterium]|nr:PIG-L family deacetylase [Anaerolineaceae bacterium]
MTWIYLSPHYDDVALSCGGVVWEQAQRGIRVEVWTVCSGEPPPGPLTHFAESLHARWMTSARDAVQKRETEDAIAMQHLGARSRSLGLPDCIYRRLPNGTPLVLLEEDLWSPVQPGETELLNHLGADLSRSIPEGATLVSPLALGRHVDHRLVRMGAEIAARSKAIRLLYYPDYPYVLKARGAPPEGMEHLFPVSEAGLAAWQQAVAAYASQISTFWSSLDEMRAAIREYCQSNSGVRLQFPCELSDSMILSKNSV